MESFNEAWELICSYCKTRITDVAYKTWISRISPVKIDFDTGDAILMVPNEFHKQTLTRCYTPLLNSAFEEIFGSNGINICFITPNSNSENKPQKNDNLAIDAVPELTFDTYIVGSSNKFAHAASLAVAANPRGLTTHCLFMEILVLAKLICFTRFVTISKKRILKCVRFT